MAHARVWFYSEIRHVKSLANQFPSFLSDLAKAEDYYRQALACFHMRADTHAGLGFVYQSAGQHARAVECYHEVREVALII